MKLNYRFIPLAVNLIKMSKYENLAKICKLLFSKTVLFIKIIKKIILGMLILKTFKNTFRLKIYFKLQNQFNNK